VKMTTPAPETRAGGSNIGGATPPPPKQQDGFKPFTPPNRGNPAQTQTGGSSSATNRVENKTSIYDQPKNEGRPVEPAPPAFNHPLAKPVPQVQERSPEQEKGVEQKFHNWEQSRPTPPPAPRAAPPASRPEPHVEPSKPKGH